MLVLERACYLLTERLLWIIPGVRVHEAAQMMCPYWYRKKELWTRKKFGTLQSWLSDSGQQVCISCWNWVSWVYFRELDGKSCLAQDYVDAGNCYALTWFVEGWETSCDKPGNVLLWPGECCCFLLLVKRLFGFRVPTDFAFLTGFPCPATARWSLWHVHSSSRSAERWGQFSHNLFSICCMDA